MFSLYVTPSDRISTSGNDAFREIPPFCLINGPNIAAKSKIVVSSKTAASSKSVAFFMISIYISPSHRERI